MLDSLLFPRGGILDQPQATKHLQTRSPKLPQLVFQPWPIKPLIYHTNTPYSKRKEKHIFTLHTSATSAAGVSAGVSAFTYRRKTKTVPWIICHFQGPTFYLVYVLPLCTANWTLKTLWSRITRRTRRTTHDKFHYCPPKIVKRECRLRRCCCFSGLTKRQIKDTNLSDHVWRKGSKVLAALLHFANAWNQLKSDIPTFGQLFKHSQ